MNHLPLIATAFSGFCVLTYTASYYAGRDGLATAVTAVMFAAFSLGLAELFVRRREIDALDEELRDFDTKNVDKALDSSSPTLRSLLSARLERAPSTTPQAIFAPYLVGALVMLGLLGTFLGLFGTLRGAHEALSASTDVDALRAGLSEPMRGLMRSFGTSAAGVSTSALLGFAALFTRRAAARLSSALDRLVAGPLATLCPARRQLDALEELSRQGRAMPEAAGALLRATEGIERLEEQTADRQAASIARIDEGMNKLTRTLETQLTTAATSLGERIASVTESSAGKLEGALGPLARSLDESSKAILETLGTELAKLLELDRKRGESLDRLSQSIREDLLATAGQLRDGLAEGLNAQKEERERSSSLAESLDEAARELGAGAAAHAKALTELGTKLGKASEAASVELQGRAENLVEALATSQREHETASRALAERLERIAETREERRETAERQLLEALAEDRKSAEAKLLSNMAESHREAAALRTAADARLLESFTGAEQALFEKLESLHQTRVSDISELFHSQAEKLGSSLSASAQLLEEASALVLAGGTEMSAVAEAFSASVAEHREAAQQWLDDLGRIEDAVARSGEGAAAEALDEHLAHTHELFERQLRFQRELFDQLRALRSPAPDLEEADENAA